MTREERNNKLKHFITCIKCEVSGKCCDENCPIQYGAGNMGEIIENLEEISKILEQEPCEDAISRKAVLDMATTIQTDDCSGNEVMEVVNVDDIKTLHPVTPARKKPIVHAHWDVIDQDSEGDEVFVHTWETLCCSRCGMERTIEDGYIPQYCESCGSKMDE